MRKIIASEFYTLDGLMSDPKDEMAWVIDTFSEDMGKYEDELYANADTLLQGRLTHQIWENYWPQAVDNPETPEGEQKMARVINDMKKVVFSKTLKKVTWKNSVLFNHIDRDEILKMKQQEGKNILVIGSSSIFQQLTNLGLIDEYHLLLHPVVLGKGKPLFKGVDRKVGLKLVRTQIFQNGVAGLVYQMVENL